MELPPNKKLFIFIFGILHHPEQVSSKYFWINKKYDAQILQAKQTLPSVISAILPMGLPRWFSGKESTCQHRTLRHRFDPWVRKIPHRRKWQPTPVFLLGKSHGLRGAWWAAAHRVIKSWTQLSNSEPTPWVPNYKLRENNISKPHFANSL